MTIDSTGLTTQTYEDIIRNILENEQTFISPEIDGSPDTVLGQLNSILAAQLTLVNQGIQDVYDARNIELAEGKALDDIVSWLGIKRQAASATFGIQWFTGDVATTVIAGTVIKSETNGKTYTLDQALQLTAATCKFASIRNIFTVDSGTDYTVTVEGANYTSGTGHTTPAAMFGAIETAINGAGETYSAAVVNDRLEITSDDGEDIAVTHDTNLAVVKVTNAGAVTCTEVGTIVQPANSVQTIITAQAGLDSTNNPNAYVTGRDIETDAELRNRALAASSASGRATVDAIISAILALDGVSSCNVTEQYVSEGDAGSGQPAGSILVVVTGGTDNDIWQTIWDYKPAGVETWDAGNPANTNPAGVVLDVNGQNQFTSFSRPTSIPIYVVIEFEVYDTQVYPDTDAEAYTAITDAIKAFGNSLETGEDVVSDEFEGAVYCAVGGIKNVVVKMSDVDIPSAASGVTIAIGATEKALFSDGNTQVTNVT